MMVIKCMENHPILHRDFRDSSNLFRYCFIFYTYASRWASFILRLLYFCLITSALAFSDISSSFWLMSRLSFSLRVSTNDLSKIIMVELALDQMTEVDWLSRYTMSFISCSYSVKACFSFSRDWHFSWSSWYQALRLLQEEELMEEMVVNSSSNEAGPIKLRVSLSSEHSLATPSDILIDTFGEWRILFLISLQVLLYLSVSILYLLRYSSIPLNWCSIFSQEAWLLAREIVRSSFIRINSFDFFYYQIKEFLIFLKAVVLIIAFYAQSYLSLFQSFLWSYKLLNFSAQSSFLSFAFSVSPSFRSLSSLDLSSQTIPVFSSLSFAIDSRCVLASCASFAFHSAST